MTHSPTLYQVNTRIWLGELGRRLGRPATFDDVPDAFLDEVRAWGFDWLWWLGAWQTGPAARAISRSNADWKVGFAIDLSDWTDADVCGSPFAVQAYTVHSDFGGDAALARLRERMSARGLKLMLDFVPNHTAPDHRWVRERPEFYIHGSDADLAREPHNFIRLDTARGPVVFAHGRDPYFDGWRDTLQMNYRHAEFRAAMTAELVGIAGKCDGVRCDMAMLILPDVIARTWGERARPADGSTPVDELFWPEATAAARMVYPAFTFMAEVYWDREWELQQQGFDFTYDKRLYDRLHDGNVAGVRAHLRADPEFQRRSVRFLENHDERRAAAAFPPDVHKAAAVATHLLTGMRFFHEGELDGRRVRANLHLSRRIDEPADTEMREFHTRLLTVLRRPELCSGTWRLLECRPGWEGNSTYQQFLAYLWEGGPNPLLVCVNYGPNAGQCHVPLPAERWRGRQVCVTDLMSPARYDWGGDDLIARGLFLDMPAWGHHVFELIAG